MARIHEGAIKWFTRSPFELYRQLHQLHQSCMTKFRSTKEVLNKTTESC